MLGVGGDRGDLGANFQQIDWVFTQIDAPSRLISKTDTKSRLILVKDETDPGDGLVSINTLTSWQLRRTLVAQGSITTPITPVLPAPFARLSTSSAEERSPAFKPITAYLVNDETFWSCVTTSGSRNGSFLTQLPLVLIHGVPRLPTYRSLEPVLEHAQEFLSLESRNSQGKCPEESILTPTYDCLSRYIQLFNKPSGYWLVD